MHPTFKIENGEIKDSGKFLKYVQHLNGEYNLNIEEIKLNRTLSQNNSIHLYCDLVADKLNQSGQTVQTFFKADIPMPFSMIIVKELVWKFFQKRMLEKDHTARLTTDEVTKIYDAMNIHLAEKYGVSVPFPSIDNLRTYEN